MGSRERRRRGGIVGLYRLILEHYEAVEADLLRYYGIHLKPFVHSLYGGPVVMTWSHLGRLLRQLPAGSALERSLDPEGAAWTPERWLAAHTADLLAALVWVESNKEVEKSKRAPFPERIKRPGVATPKVGNTDGLDPKVVAEFLIRFAPKEVVESVD